MEDNVLFVSKLYPDALLSTFVFTTDYYSIFYR